MSFSGEDDASAGFLEKFRDRASDTGAGFVHKRFDLNATSECSRFCSSHLRRRQNWQAHQPSRSDDATRASVSAGFDEVFFRRLLFLAERFERLFLDLVTLVWSMYGCSGMLSAVATRVVLKPLPTA